MNNFITLLDKIVKSNLTSLIQFWFITFILILNSTKDFFLIYAKTSTIAKVKYQKINLNSKF